MKPPAVFGPEVVLVYFIFSAVEKSLSRLQRKLMDGVSALADFMARFTQVTFGASATEEALRRHTACSGIAIQDLAVVWRNVDQVLSEKAQHPTVGLEERPAVDWSPLMISGPISHVFHTVLSARTFAVLLNRTCIAPFSMEVVAGDSRSAPSTRLVSVDFCSAGDRDAAVVTLRLVENVRAAMFY